MSEENEWADDPDMQEFLEWADQPGPWDEEDDKIHTVGGLTNDKENGFMSFVNKTKMSEEETYSIPIYENGVKTEYTIDGVIGDEKYQQLIEMTPEKKLPAIFNVNLNQNKDE